MKDILYLHDDQGDPRALIQVLEMAGYTVTLAQDAKRFLSTLQDSHPALLIADVLLHHMNGFELCARVRQLYDAKRLPIVMLAGIYRGTAYYEQAMRAGAQQYLSEPTASELGHHVVELIGHPLPA